MAACAVRRCEFLDHKERAHWTGTQKDLVWIVERGRAG